MARLRTEFIYSKPILYRSTRVIQLELKLKLLPEILFCTFKRKTIKIGSILYSLYQKQYAKERIDIKWLLLWAECISERNALCQCWNKVGYKEMFIASRVSSEVSNGPRR